MTNFYWIIAQHSGKVLEVEGASIFQPARIIQVTKKSEHDPIVDAQLWYFNGGFIANKRSGFMLDVAGGTQIIQYVRYAESCAAQEWDYNHEDNTISLKHDRKFVLDVSGEKIILYEKHGSKNQQFILQKWNDCSTVIENTITTKSNQVVPADDFVTIGQECFLEFLTKYSDSLKQIDVWNKLIEWAIAKSNNELPSDATMWTIDNITTFGTLIQPFISHINFQKVSSIDFITKIKPFKSIFDDTFYNKIVEDHCLNADLTSPQIVKYLDSQIINLRDASLICNWIKAMKKQKWETRAEPAKVATN
ncbi:15672_t:CDS:2 [Rhizophagus irregularis]|nr:15672_t:CDS:2 [Rhizophagus irregularis]